MYTEECPKHDPSTLLDLDLEVAQTTIVFDYELIFRIVDYFFDKFLWAISDSDPYKLLVDPEKGAKTEKARNLANLSKEEVLAFMLEQDETLMNLKISLTRPLIILKDRHYAEEGFEFDLGNISVTQSSKWVDGRFYNCPQKRIL